MLPGIDENICKSVCTSQVEVDAVGEDEEVPALAAEAGWPDVPSEWINVLRRDHLRQQQQRMTTPGSSEGAGTGTTQVLTTHRGSWGLEGLYISEPANGHLL